MIQNKIWKICISWFLKIGCIGSGEQDVRFKESCDYFFIHNYHTTFYEQGCVYNF